MNPDMFAALPGRADVGRKVSDFSFETFNPAEGGFEKHSLGEYLSKGRWVVLFFYPADFTFVCPTELADLANQHAKLQELGVEVISVSTDSKFAHLAWRNSEKLIENVKFQMAADPTGTISHYFGVYDDTAGTAYRGTFIISPDSLLVGAEVNFYNVGRNAEELVRKIEANVHLRKNPAEACPARWTPGKQTLTPSESMVGNVYDAVAKYL
ncbi:peroxiredoxin [Desulfovibrio sp. OttesenSCG-928-O18]|nr:peroxiredoxin [Desulfovibrio sp. OttesenSCG-928-O18]